MLIKHETLLGRHTWVEIRRVREPRRTALPCGHRLRFYGDGISFWVASDQSFWPVLPGGTCIAQPRWMPGRRILGVGTTCGIFSTFPRILPVGGGLLVPCSLLGPPVVK